MTETLENALNATEKGCLEIGQHILGLQDTAAFIVALQDRMRPDERDTSATLLVALRRMINDLTKGE